MTIYWLLQVYLYRRNSETNASIFSVHKRRYRLQISDRTHIRKHHGINRPIFHVQNWARFERKPWNGKRNQKNLTKIMSAYLFANCKGCPSMSILLNELMKLVLYAGCKDVTFFRMGTCGGIGLKPGTLIVSEEAVDGMFRPQYRQVLRIYIFPIQLRGWYWRCLWTVLRSFWAIKYQGTQSLMKTWWRNCWKLVKSSKKRIRMLWKILCLVELCVLMISMKVWLICFACDLKKKQNSEFFWWNNRSIIKSCFDY